MRSRRCRAWETPQSQRGPAKNPLLLIRREERHVLPDQLQFLAIWDAPHSLAMHEAGGREQPPWPKGVLDPPHSGKDVDVGIHLRLRVVVELGDLDVNVRQPGQAEE